MHCKYAWMCQCNNTHSRLAQTKQSGWLSSLALACRLPINNVFTGSEVICLPAPIIFFCPHIVCFPSWGLHKTQSDRFQPAATADSLFPPETLNSSLTLGQKPCNTHTHTHTHLTHIKIQPLATFPHTHRMLQLTQWSYANSLITGRPHRANIYQTPE